MAFSQCIRFISAESWSLEEEDELGDRAQVFRARDVGDRDLSASVAGSGLAVCTLRRANTVVMSSATNEAKRARCQRILLVHRNQLNVARRDASPSIAPAVENAHARKHYASS